MVAVQAHVLGSLFFCSRIMNLSFEDKVFAGLNHSLSLCGASMDGIVSIGVAVSGGADSISLLYALKKILPEKINLKAVTVNHNIRSSEETCGDADFVDGMCRKLQVECRRYEIPRGMIFESVGNEGYSIEDFARKVRYEKFQDFIESEKIDFLCLAHNRNDQQETVLMRLIQGSSDFSGIPEARGKFIRPLLCVSRAEIEQYLAENSLEYRTDSTNFDNSMLRNKIRNCLVPLMNEKFSGWQKGIDSACEKSRLDNEALNFYADESIKKIFCSECSNGVTFDSGIFFSLPEAVRTRILMKFVKKLGAKSRMPYAFLKRWSTQSYAAIKKKEFSRGLEFSLGGGRFFIAKKSRVATEEGFFVIMEEDGIFKAGDLTLCVKKIDGGLYLESKGISLELADLNFPIAVRSRQSGDFVECNDGSHRSVSKILDNWKTRSMRDKIPLVQKIDGSLCGIKCIWGAVYGFENWIAGGTGCP